MTEFKPLTQSADPDWERRWPDIRDRRFPNDTTRIIYGVLRRVQEVRGQGTWIMQDEMYKQSAYSLDLNPENVMESDFNKQRIRKALNWLVDQSLVSKTNRRTSNWPYSQAAYRAKIKWVEVIGTVVSLNEDGDMMTVETKERVYMRWVGHDWEFVNPADEDDVDEDDNYNVIGKTIRFMTSREEQETYSYS